MKSNLLFVLLMLSIASFAAEKECVSGDDWGPICAIANRSSYTVILTQIESKEYRVHAKRKLAKQICYAFNAPKLESFKHERVSFVAIDLSDLVTQSSGKLKTLQTVTCEL